MDTVPTFMNSIGTPAIRVCRSARLAGGFLWLLSSTLAFGQSSPLPATTTLEPRADSEPVHGSQPGPDQVHNLFSMPPLQLPPLPRLSAIPSEETALFSTASRISPVLSSEQKVSAFEIEPVWSEESSSGGFQWGRALGQSALFLGIEHSIRLAFDPPSRTAFSGKFWKELERICGLTT